MGVTVRCVQRRTWAALGKQEVSDLIAQAFHLSVQIADRTDALIHKWAEIHRNKDLHIYLGVLGQRNMNRQILHHLIHLGT